MVDFPSFEALHPRDWVRAMRAVRERTAEAGARVLDAHRVPALAQPQLQELLDDFTGIDLNTPTISRLEAQLSVEVHAHADSLVFWIFPTRRYLTITPTPAGHWWLEPAGAHPATGEAHQIHVELMLRLLEMLPWADDDALAELAAIEIATRAG